MRLAKLHRRCAQHPASLAVFVAAGFGPQLAYVGTGRVAIYLATESGEVTRYTVRASAIVSRCSSLGGT